MFAQQLESVGIKLKIRFLELNRWLKEVMLDRDFEIAFGEWTFNIDTNIIETLFSSASLKSGGNNFVSYSNPKIDELLTVNKFCFDPDKRIKNKYAMHKIIHEDCPYIFLFSLPQYAGIRSNILKNVEIHPYNFFLFITSWHLSEEELGF
jgi:peptide/nickel transport system substrate-binding protein